MKLQVGLINRDGSPASTIQLARLLDEFRDHSADTKGELIDGPIAMAYRGDHITEEDQAEKQPLNDGRYALTWDGRLDNRDELAARLSLKNIYHVPDSLLVLCSYRAFGESILTELIGEFALTLWSKGTRSVLFVRSACGSRPLYYVLTKGVLLWSSNFAQLVRVSGVELRISESYMLEYLISQPDPGHTPLEDMKVVPPGTAVRFENDQVSRPYRLWRPETIEPLSYRSDAQYEELCREKLTEAVRARLRSKYPVFSELSGGFDSSSLVLTADQIFRATGKPLTSLGTISCIFDDSETSDERHFIRSIEDLRGIPSCYVRECEHQVTLGLRDIEFTGIPSAFHCFRGRFPAYARIMRSHNARVLFTGSGGDNLFWSAVDGTALIADELTKFNLVGAHRECRLWSRCTTIPYAYLLFRQAVPLAMGSDLVHVWERRSHAVPSWLWECHREHFRCIQADREAQTAVRGLPSRRAHFRLVDLLLSYVSAGFLGEYHEIYISHPYTYRPLVEFCLATPVSQFLRDGQTRSLMKRSLRALLPSKILTRQSKASPQEAFIRALQREWNEIGDVRQWELCQRGFADPQLLLGDLKKLKIGLQPPGAGIASRVFSLERWLRSLRCIGERNRAAPLIASTRC